MVLTLPDVGGQLIVVLSLRLDCEVVVPLLLQVGHLELLDPPQHRAVVGLSGLSRSRYGILNDYSTTINGLD